MAYRLGSSLVILPLWHYKKEGIQSSSSECKDLVYEVKLCVEDGKCQLKLNVCVDPDMPPSDSSEQWLCDVILHKMAKWMEEPPLRKPNISSLQLLPIDAYNDLYQHLKEKYGRELVEKWPERTDPQKFVFEDVAIATYLLVTWERERVDLGLEKKQSFADLGCGNGLLVHILRQEGHPGFGIDVRKRNIWDMYGDSIDLREAPIIPSDTNLFSNTDWLIGNHSDELTPWIPVMAARSSYNTRFFVLPCCHHDFDSKFSGKNAGESQYRTYLDFIKTVCEVCGFDVLEDALRIPSTKRICLIGKSRSYTTSEEAMVDQRITEYIKSRCKNMVDNHCPIQLTGHSHGTPLDSDNEHAVSVNRTGDGQLQTTNTTDKLQTTNTTDKAWALSFQPRAKVEKVRNCTQLPHDLTSEVVQRVFDAVLNAEDAVLMCTEYGRNWCKGGVVPLSSIVSLLGSDILKRLKSECGGVQTLLRNHHNIFQVSGGAVRLRYDDQDGHNLQYNVPPRKKQKIKQKDLKQKPVKTKLCWFHDNHPDGCPKTREHCQFAHGAEDLNKGSQHEQN
ncbi:probable tRNA (uracil-O(2)-)-methyltransferase [Lingula anatina]|uniref:tRNA (uracil-O(2)-)-methyltransferase n=1 Tax=Lingula anatina TaxID=7574 RepID=A0A1S3HBM8_LINAN|nr:probable tRNA (uracil-O(2)-)-methyltransferase [Lingula anatina]|eukprot:XP_013383420.1 probable tRNA (uracil-O(2)-)-methyltransferase [Lingula anatina]